MKGSDLNLKSNIATGGVSYLDQIEELKKGCDVLFATPGRLSDLVERNKIDLSKVKFLCFDEFDRICDLGFEPCFRSIVEVLPPPGERQTTIFTRMTIKVQERKKVRKSENNRN